MSQSVKTVVNEATSTNPTPVVGPESPGRDGASRRPEPMALINPSKELAHRVEEELGGPAICYPGRLVQKVLKEEGGSMALTRAGARHRRYWLSWCPVFFVGAMSSENRTESKHVHCLQDELYIVCEGVIRIRCTLGKNHCEAVGGPGSAIFVPRGSVHLVTWDVPGWGYAIKGPQVWCDAEAAKEVIG